MIVGKNNKKHTKIQPFVVLCNNEDHTGLVESICRFSVYCMFLTLNPSMSAATHNRGWQVTEIRQTDRPQLTFTHLHIQKKIPFDREYLCFITVAEEMPQAYACYAVILKLGVQVLMHIIDTFNIRSSEHQ